MKRTVIGSLPLLVVGLAGAVGVFVMTSVMMGVLPDSVTVALAVLGGFLLAQVLSGGRSVVVGAVDERRAVLTAAIGGVASFWGAPLLALSQRASDAPPGTEVLFFTTCAWGLLAVLSAYVARETRPPWVVGAAGLLAVLGGATLLANWERPSSFSPFVRFPVQESLMLLAGVIFAVGAIAMVSGCRIIGIRRGSVAALGAAFMVGALASIPALPEAVPTIASAWRAVFVLMVSSAAFSISWIRLSVAGSVTRAAGVWLLVPSALTLLTIVERLTSVKGPDPIVWAGATAGIVLSVVGTAVLLIGEPVVAARRPRGGRILVFGGIGAVALAAAGLLTSGMNATVAGALGGEYRAQWTMLGAETVSGWLAFALALLVLAAAVDGTRGRRAAPIAAAIAVLVGTLTYLPLASTPLRTATRWIPADVQQTYGTEYARLTFTPVHDPVRLVAVAVAVVVAIAVIVAATRSSADSSPTGGAE